MKPILILTNSVLSAQAPHGYWDGRLLLKAYGNADLEQYDYDAEGRRTRSLLWNATWQNILRFDYGWDAGGNLLAITNNSTNVTLYGYDQAGQLTNEIAFTIGLSGTNRTDWVYDAAGNWLNPPWEDTRWVYNPDNELIGLTEAGDWNWSVAVTGEVEPGPSSNKWYNTWAECRGVWARVSTNDGTFTLANVPVYAGTNELVVTVTDVSGNSSQQTRKVVKECLDCIEQFYYDGNGNLTNWVSGAQNRVYEWDWADRLTKVTSNNVVVLENWYDAQSRRIAKKESVGGQTQSTLYVWDGWDSVAVLDEAAAILETFTRGVGLAGDIGTLVAVTHHTGANAGTHYTHHNHRGDIVLARTGATTTATYKYSSFGTLTGQTGSDLSRFKFSNKERDSSTGFSYYGYRFYASQWQRWLNVDPIAESGGVNLYSFVENHPVNDLDALGLLSASCFGSCMVACMLGFDEPPPCEWSPPPFASVGATLLASYEAATAKCPKSPEGKACRQAKKLAQKYLGRLLIKIGVKSGLRAVPFVGWGLVAVDATICGFKCEEACRGH